MEMSLKYRYKKTNILLFQWFNGIINIKNFDPNITKIAENSY